MRTEGARDQPSWWSLTVLLLLTAVWGTGLAQVTCPRKCTCTPEMVNCAEKRLTTPPQDYPAGTTTINIEGNHIRVLGSQTFTPQPNVETLLAAGNRIRRLSDDAFWMPFPNLRSLDLSRNRIRRIASNALRNMSALTMLDLTRNQIRSLRRIFHGSPNLYEVKLARNRISRLGENDLAPLTTLRTVDLRANMISYIHPRAFKTLTTLRYLFLQNNPIVQVPSLEFGSQMIHMVDMTFDELVAVPKPFPASTKEFRLSNNEITEVNSMDFRTIEDLQLLIMDDNRLTYFADDALSHMDNLMELWLRNNEMVYIPRNLPDKVGRIHMQHNLIQQIETGLFRETSQLNYLDVQSNTIERIQPNTFSGLRFLQTLNFQSNQISVLEPDTFADLGTLSTIKLSMNPLVRIENNAFRNLANLSSLTLAYIEATEFELDYNFLTEMLRLKTLQLYASPGLAQSLMTRLSEGHLTPLSRMERVDLSHCDLTTLPPQIRQLFPNIRALILDNEPKIRCTQGMRWLKGWMDEAVDTVQFFTYPSYQPKCSTPFRLYGRAITSLLDNEWGTEEEVNAQSLVPQGANYPEGSQWGMANDQPQEQRMREPQRGKVGEKSDFLGALVKVQGSDEKEAKDVEAAKGKEKVGPMNMVSAVIKGVRMTEEEESEKRKPSIKTTKPKRKSRKGKKGKVRRKGKKGKKGKKGGRRRYRGKKERKNRKDRKAREKKRRRRVTINTSTPGRRAEAKNAQ